MKLILLKDWGKNKKGDSVTIEDKSVIKKGLSVGLFTDQELPETETILKTKKNKKDEKNT